MQRKVDIDLSRFLHDNPVLFDKWSKREDIRLHPREFNSHRTKGDFFDNSELIDLINPEAINIENPIKILFSHFSPYQYELGALGLPSYASKSLMGSMIDLTYDKGSKAYKRFTIDGNKVVKKAKLEEKYDIIIARSSALMNMMRRPDDRQTVENSKFVINVRTMSYKPNYQFANYYFEEEELCEPPDPHMQRFFNKFLIKNKKKDLIAVSGTLWHVKNQLNMFNQIDPNIVKDFKIVIMGTTQHIDYVNKIIKVCDAKGLDYYLIGSVCQDLAHEIKCLSKISLIPMDMRVFGQPKGYPRTLGESIGARCLTICNKPVTIPDFYKESCMVYDESISNDLNKKISEAVLRTSKENFIKNHNWGDKDFFDVCEETLVKCLNLSGNKILDESNNIHNKKQSI